MPVVHVLWEHVDWVRLPAARLYRIQSALRHSVFVYGMAQLGVEGRSDVVSSNEPPRVLVNIAWRAAARHDDIETTSSLHSFITNTQPLLAF